MTLTLYGAPFGLLSPYDFSPDPESCTDEQISRWMSACQAFDRDDPWDAPHGCSAVLWGLGTFVTHAPEVV